MCVCSSRTSFRTRGHEPPLATATMTDLAHRWILGICIACLDDHRWIGERIVKLYKNVSLFWRDSSKVVWHFFTAVEKHEATGQPMPLVLSLALGFTDLSPPMLTSNSVAPSMPCPDAATCGANTTFIHLLQALSVGSREATSSPSS